MLRPAFLGVCDVSEGERESVRVIEVIEGDDGAVIMACRVDVWLSWAEGESKRCSSSPDGTHATAHCTLSLLAAPSMRAG
jgi:hypothetical protein